MRHRRVTVALALGATDDEAALIADIVAIATNMDDTAIGTPRRCCTRPDSDELQARRADLAAGGAEAHSKAVRAKVTVAERRIMHQLRLEHRNHAWAYDFVQDRTHDGRKHRMLNIIDELIPAGFID
jgi:hypothetical protein